MTRLHLPIVGATDGPHDAYQMGALVTFEGQVWRSTIDANVWPPGVYGWEVVP